MFIVVLENTINGVCSEVEVIKEAYNKHSMAIVKKDESLQSLKRFSQPPLTQRGWLLLCESDCSKSTLNSLKKLPWYNVCLFHVTSNRELNKLSELMKEEQIDFKLVDNLVPERRKVIDYVMGEINTERDVAGYLFDRYKGYMPDIVNTVYALKVLKNVTKVDVRKYGVQRNKYAIFHLAEYLLGINDLMTYKEAVKVVYDYRYNFQYLAKYLQTYTQQYIDVFSEVGVGNLTLSNLGSYTPIRSLKNLHQYQLKLMIENYERISMTKLVWLNCMISKLGSSSFSCIKLISILSVNK